VVQVVGLLRQLFGQEYDFELEDATEAGIVWTKYPKQVVGGYKSFRFHFHGGLGRREFLGDYDDESELALGWPTLTDERLEGWTSGVLVETLWVFSDREGDTGEGNSTLKALYGAPPWTAREVNMFRNALQQFDIECTPCPPAASLRSIIN
jgi:hypothetical protein